jgi:flagellar protein FlgJ
MADIKALSMDSTLFQLRAAGADRIAMTSPSEIQRKINSDADLQQASEQFESLLLNFMIREMRATVPESTLFPKSMAEEIFSDMLDEKIAGQMAQNGGIGISQMIFNQLKKGE